MPTYKEVEQKRELEQKKFPIVYAKTIDVRQIKTKRAGVIPYVNVNGNLHFLMGRDTTSKDWTDFGGGVKLGETALSGAIREFKEETYRIFDDEVYSPSNFENSMAVTDYKFMTIFFIKIDEKWLYEANTRFYKVKKMNEVDRIVWIHENRFQKIIHYGEEKMWSKVRNFLCNVNSNLYYILKTECCMKKYIPLYSFNF